MSHPFFINCVPFSLREILDTLEIKTKINKDEIVPLSIANNFTMTYTDSTITRSYVSGKTHYDFSNTELNYSEFFEDVELIIYDDDKTSIIKSDYAIIYNSLRFIEFNGNVEITTTNEESLTASQLFYDTENEWLFTEEKFQYSDKTNKIWQPQSTNP